MENLVYALDREPTKEELEKVIKSSRSEFIYELPNGLETEI
jgi:ABC-type multidrug transport system fused ATPase/permease subunit